MKYIKSIVLFILTSFTAHADLIEDLNLSTIASGVDVQNGDLIIRTNKSGTKFAAVIDDHFDRVLKYDEVIRLPRGFKKAHFFEHHLGYRIEKEGDEDGVYNIQFRINMHAFGENLTIHNVKFRIKESSIDILSKSTKEIPLSEKSEISRAVDSGGDSKNVAANSYSVDEMTESSQQLSRSPPSSFQSFIIVSSCLILIVWMSFQARRKSARRLK